MTRVEEYFEPVFLVKDPVYYQLGMQKGAKETFCQENLRDREGSQGLFKIDFF